MEMWLTIGAVALLVIWIIKIYNNLVSFRSHYKNGFQQISVQLKRRADLIGNLVEIAKKYMEHESETLLAVTMARQGLIDATKGADSNPGDHGAMMALQASQLSMDKAMGGFSLKMEAYPDLKASDNMAQLSEELISTENKVSYARQGYNDLVQKFNEYRQQFPNVVFAGMFGFGQNADNLEFAESIADLNIAPKVQF